MGLASRLDRLERQAAERNHRGEQSAPLPFDFDEYRAVFLEAVAGLDDDQCNAWLDDFGRRLVEGRAA